MSTTNEGAVACVTTSNRLSPGLAARWGMVLAAALAAAGCNCTPTDGPTPPTPTVTDPPLPVPAEAWAPRALALLNEGQYDCEAIVKSKRAGSPGGEWRGKRLFPDPPANIQRRARVPKHPDRMRRLCAYDWHPNEGKGDRRPGKQDFQNLGRGKRAIREDFAVASSMQTPERLRDARQDDRIKVIKNQMAFPKTQLNGPASGVLLGVIDSSPRGVVALGASGGPYIGECPANPHGFQMARLAQAAACPSGNGCAVSVWTELALPYTTPPMVPPPEPNEDKCGSFGMRSHVAERIEDLLTLWWEHQEQYPHLVINLSLGWVKRKARPVWSHAPIMNELDGDLAEEAVEHALRRAACAGALTFAAAGNNPGYAGEDDILSPAALQSETVTPGMCQALGFKVGREDRPVVVAVGGVNDSELPIPMSRKEGIPELMASGFEVGLEQTSAAAAHADWLIPVTGTSASTAVVSGIAAGVWSAYQGGTAKDVYDKLREHATQLGFRATYCQGTAPCQRAGLVSYCHTLQAVSPGQNLDCPARKSFEFPSKYALLTPSNEVPYFPGLVGGQPVYPSCPNCYASTLNAILQHWNFGDTFSSTYVQRNNITEIKMDRIEMFTANMTGVPAAVGTNLPAFPLVLPSTGWTWPQGGSLAIDRSAKVWRSDTSMTPTSLVLTMKQTYNNGSYIYVNHSQTLP